MRLAAFTERSWQLWLVEHCSLRLAITSSYGKNVMQRGKKYNSLLNVLHSNTVDQQGAWDADYSHKWWNAKLMIRKSNDPTISQNLDHYYTLHFVVFEEFTTFDFYYARWTNSHFTVSIIIVLISWRQVILSEGKHTNIMIKEKWLGR